MLERLASPACQSIFADWTKCSRNGNRQPIYSPAAGDFDETLQATTVLIFSLCYSATLKATAQWQFEADTAFRLEHGPGYASRPAPRGPLMVLPQGRALKQLVHMGSAGPCRGLGRAASRGSGALDFDAHGE